jgi:hypothetical protein
MSEDVRRGDSPPLRTSRIIDVIERVRIFFLYKLEAIVGR